MLMGRMTYCINNKLNKLKLYLINIDTSHNRVIVLNLFSSLGAIFHRSLPGESAERVVKSRKHLKLTWKLVIVINPADNVIWDR